MFVWGRCEGAENGTALFKVEWREGMRAYDVRQSFICDKLFERFCKESNLEKTSLELFSAQSMQKKVSSVKVDVGAVINEASLATLSGKSKLPLVM